jgi:predicted Zn-ribbon and HTH transcriptional regulator
LKGAVYFSDIKKMARISLDGYLCERCGHKWISRGKKKPIVCPKCKSPYWNEPRKNKKRGKNES